MAPGLDTEPSWCSPGQCSCCLQALGAPGLLAVFLLCSSGWHARASPLDRDRSSCLCLDRRSPGELGAGRSRGPDDKGPDLVLWQTHELSGQLNPTIDVVREPLGCRNGILYIRRVVPCPSPAPLRRHRRLLDHSEGLHLARSQRRRSEAQSVGAAESIHSERF
jgi:hypothetical protein